MENPTIHLHMKAYLLYWSVFYSVGIVIVINDVQVFDSIFSICQRSTELNIQRSFPSAFCEYGEVGRLPIFYT